MNADLFPTEQAARLLPASVAYVYPELDSGEIACEICAKYVEATDRLPHWVAVPPAWIDLIAHIGTVEHINPMLVRLTVR